MAKEVQILRPNRKRILVTVEGISPLLQNRFSEKSKEEIVGKQTKKARAAKEARDPEAEFLSSMHVIDTASEADGNGNATLYGIPSTAFKLSVASAWVRFAGERSSKGLKGAINIERPLVPLEAPPPEMSEDAVKIPGQSWTIAYRGKFWPWKVTLPINFDQNFLSTEQLINLLMTAGYGVGVGCWRPENSGDHGQFIVTEVQEVSK